MEWVQFWQQEGGFGEDKADYRTGLLASVVANVGGAKRQDKKPFQPSDFMPFAKSKAKKKGPSFKQFASIVGGRLKKKDGEEADGREDQRGEGS